MDRAGAVASSLGSVRQEKRRGSAAARRDREKRDRPGGEDLVGETRGETSVMETNTGSL